MSITLIALSKSDSEDFESTIVRIFDLEYGPQIAYGIDSTCFYMKLTLNAKDRDNLKEEGTLRLFLLKKEDLA